MVAKKANPALQTKLWETRAPAGRPGLITCATFNILSPALHKGTLLRRAPSARAAPTAGPTSRQQTGLAFLTLLRLQQPNRAAAGLLAALFDKEWRQSTQRRFGKTRKTPAACLLAKRLSRVRKLQATCLAYCFPGDRCGRRKPGLSSQGRRVSGLPKPVLPVDSPLHWPALLGAAERRSVARQSSSSPPRFAMPRVPACPDSATLPATRSASV